MSSSRTSPKIRPGQSGKITVQAYPGRVFDGRGAFVYPTVNAQTRTAKVRIEVPNPDLLLKTDMYATVEISGPGRRATTVLTGTGIFSRARYRHPTNRFLSTAATDALSRARSSSARAPGGYVAVLEGIRDGEKVRYRRQFPDRCREQSARRPAGLHGAEGKSP